jgi:hypothetical protein
MPVKASIMPTKTENVKVRDEKVWNFQEIEKVEKQYPNREYCQLLHPKQEVGTYLFLPKIFVR